MEYDRVTTVQKQEARDILRLAKRRGVRLTLTKEQLTDPDHMRRFFAIFGDPPSDSLCGRAAQIANYLKIKLTPEQAMNKWHCKKFIVENKIKVPGGLPTENQIRLAEQLAEYHGISVPPGVRVSLDEWYAFFERYLGREQRDELHELEMELGISVDSNSYGPMVYILNKYKKVLTNRTLLRNEKMDSIREFLLKGDDPFTLATDLNVDIQIVFDVVGELEATGHELVY